MLAQKYKNTRLLGVNYAGKAYNTAKLPISEVIHKVTTEPAS